MVAGAELHREVEQVEATPVIMFIYSPIDRPLLRSY